MDNQPNAHPSFSGSIYYRTFGKNFKEVMKTCMTKNTEIGSATVERACELINATKQHHNQTVPGSKDNLVCIPKGVGKLMELGAHLDVALLSKKQAKELRNTIVLCVIDLDSHLRDVKKALRAAERIQKEETVPLCSLKSNIIYALDKIAKFHRALNYRRSGKPMFPVPTLRLPSNVQDDIVGIGMGKWQSAGLVLVARINKLRSWEQSGLERYPEKDRYTSLVPTAGMSRKEIQEFWMPCPKLMYRSPAETWLEWRPFSHSAVYLTLAQNAFHTVTDEYFKDLKRKGLLVTPAIEFYTSDCTQEAMISDEPECYACTYNFGQAFSDDQLTEPAVMTDCGHMHGKGCLEEWVRSGNLTCPKCRAPMVDKALLLPSEIRREYVKLPPLLKEAMKLDERIDHYLLEGFELNRMGESPSDFGELLHQMVSIAERLIAAMRALKESL